MFSTCLENFLLFSSNLKLLSANCFNLDQSKILSSGNGLKELGNRCSGGYSIHVIEIMFKMVLNTKQSIKAKSINPCQPAVLAG